MSKLSRSKEKIQVKWGIELFNRFVLFAAKRGILSLPQAHTLQEELEEFSQVAVGDDVPESIAKQLNQYIGMINVQLKRNLDATSYIPFPTFSFASEGFAQSAVLDQLNMVERTLTEAAEAGLIDWDAESDTFGHVLKIFDGVENQKMRPEEGMAELLSAIEKINKLPPAENVLPLPDLGAYE